jgi:hypothetical protein
MTSAAATPTNANHPRAWAADLPVVRLHEELCCGCALVPVAVEPGVWLEVPLVVLVTVSVAHAVLVTVFVAHVVLVTVSVAHVVLVTVSVAHVLCVLVADCVLVFVAVEGLVFNRGV